MAYIREPITCEEQLKKLDKIQKKQKPILREIGQRPHYKDKTEK